MLRGEAAKVQKSEKSRPRKTSQESTGKEAPLTTAASNAATANDVKPKQDRKPQKKTNVVDISSKQDEDESSVESANDERPVAGVNKVESSVALVQTASSAKSSKESPPPTSRNPIIVSTMHGCFDEAEWYLGLLTHLPLASTVIDPSLQEMVFQWPNRGLDMNSIRTACHEPAIAT